LAPDEVFGRTRLRGFTLLATFYTVKFWSTTGMIDSGLAVGFSSASNFKVMVLYTLFSMADC
jgi:hypothetical protein